jgi:hypothetical protein
MNRKEVLRQLVKSGASVSKVKKTGEVRVTHPRMSKPITCNGRRKDATRALLVFLRRVESGEFDHDEAA